MKTSVVMNEGLCNCSKNVYVSLLGILKKTINFHDTKVNSLANVDITGE